MRATSKLAAAALLSALLACGSSSNSPEDGGSPDGGSGSPEAGGSPDGGSGPDTSFGVDSTSPPDAPSGTDALLGVDSASATDASGEDAPSGAGAMDGASGNDASGDAGPRGDSAAPDAAAAALGIDPAMGWSSWSFIRQGPTESGIEAQAKALHDSGLSGHGYKYANIDDFYYLNPSTNVDANGRWVVDSKKFPNGMAAVATFVHGLGLSFGMYLTAGIPVAAVTQNTLIEGTTYHAADIAIPGSYQINYNFGDKVMQSIDYSKPGAQEFINSWANLLASYGVDYVKIDGVGSFDIPDVKAWSAALKSSGRVIHFELSNQLSINDASTWAALANGWRIEGDIECYCPFGASYPLTSWQNVSGRFNDDPPWQRFSAPGARNDLDSIEVGNGNNDGLAVVERQTQMSLWALAASPFILGVDLTNLDPGDLALLTNDEVIAVDQAGVAAKQLVSGNAQVWVAAEPDGSFAVGLFNLGGATASITIPWSDLGISGSATVRDLWAQKDLGSFTGSFATSVASHGVALVRIVP